LASTQKRKEWIKWNKNNTRRFRTGKGMMAVPEKKEKFKGMKIWIASQETLNEIRQRKKAE
jgi:hypothetical protein